MKLKASRTEFKEIQLKRRANVLFSEGTYHPEGKQEQRGDEFKNQTDGKSKDSEWKQNQPQHGKQEKHNQRDRPASH